MHSRTRRPLAVATLMLLAVACATTLGASKAAAASQHVTTKVKKISACGAVITKAGTYELTKSVTDSGSDCIILAASNVTLYLDSHTITGTGTDACIAVTGSGSYSVKDTVFGGTMPNPRAKTKVKPKPAKLTNCGTGLTIAATSGTTASYLTIVAPGNAGVLGEQVVGASVSHINVPMHAANPGAGFAFQGGADNVVMDSTVNYDGSGYAFYAVNETGDTFLRDTVNDPYNSAGGPGTGFYDHQSARDTWSHCTSSGQYDGFYLGPLEYGPVTLTYDTATGSSANAASFGFEIAGAFQFTDSASPFHTLVSHNKATGFGVGFEDQNAGIPGTPSAEKWIDNTADNYSGVGFLISYPPDYTMTGNIADANTSGKKYTSGDTYGFVLVDVSSAFPFALFANNQAYDSKYGFYSAGLGVGGKGNIAKRNQINSVGVEITG